MYYSWRLKILYIDKFIITMMIARNLNNTKIQSSLLACMFAHYCTLLQRLILRNSGILLIRFDKISDEKNNIRDTKKIRVKN